MYLHLRGGAGLCLFICASLFVHVSMCVCVCMCVHFIQLHVPVKETPLEVGRDQHYWRDNKVTSICSGTVSKDSRCCDSANSHDKNGAFLVRYPTATTPTCVLQLSKACQKYFTESVDHFRCLAKKLLQGGLPAIFPSHRRAASPI